MTKFIVQQHTGTQYEPVPDGDFDDAISATDAMRELENECGFRDLRVVKDAGPRYNLSGKLLTGDDAHEVVEYGLESDAD